MMPLNGEMMTIHRASALYGVPENTLRDRVAGGMTLQEAVDTPYVPKGSPLYSYNGERMTKKGDSRENRHKPYDAVECDVSIRL